MNRLRLVGLIALALVTPAAAQVTPVTRAPQLVRPVPVTVAPPAQAAPDQGLDLIATDPELARKTIAQLRKEKRELDARLKAALATIDAMTKRGGSQVRAYCESPTLSRNTAGASESCADSGYKCNEVDGLCKRRCTVSTDCATTFTCMPDGRCVRGGA